MEFKNEKLEQFNKFASRKKIAIIGLGVSNLPLLEYFYNLSCKISVFDNRTKNELDNDTREKIDKYTV